MKTIEMSKLVRIRVFKRKFSRKRLREQSTAEFDALVRKCLKMCLAEMLPSSEKWVHIREQILSNVLALPGETRVGRGW